MKPIIAVLALTLTVIFASGCTSRAGASVGRKGESHGVAVKGSTEGGVSGRVRAY